MKDETSDIFAARPCGMEARGEPRSRTQVNPRASRSGWVSVFAYATPDIRSCRDGIGGGDCGTLLILTPRGLHGSMSREGRGSGSGGNDAVARPAQKSDHPIVVTKPGNAGGAKGVTC